MLEINNQTNSATIIAVHVCQSENQYKLQEVLKMAAKNFFSKQKGFISSTIHVSFDGKAVTNYAQWESREDLQNASHEPDLANYIAQINPLIIGFEAQIYRVAEKIEK